MPPTLLRIEMRAAGVSDCFPKPFPMDGLRHSVKDALESAAETRRMRQRGARC